MNKTRIFGLLMVFACIILIYVVWKENSKSYESPPNHKYDIDSSQNQQKDTISEIITNKQSKIEAQIKTEIKKEQKTKIPGNWKRYTNTEFGLEFDYPNDWVTTGGESKNVDRLGNIIGIEVNFNDNKSMTTLLVSYHLPPNGAELFQYAVSQYESTQGWYEHGGTLIKIAGKKAVKANTIMDKSGKGTPIDPPLRVILVDFLDNKQTGSYQLQFKTPLPGSEPEVAKFETLLNSIKFIN